MIKFSKKNKKTHEQFEKEVVHLNIELLEQLINVDTRILYRCKHGINRARPDSLRNYKWCCRKGFYENRVPFLKKSIEDWKPIIQQKYNSNIVFTEYSKIRNHTKHKYAIIDNLLCIKHNYIFSMPAHYAYKINLACKFCKSESKSNIAKQKILEGKFGAAATSKCISKPEREWLNSFNKKIKRQFVLKDLGYQVDGYEEDTNTVYLYHGGFWHGQPPKYYKMTDLNPANGKTFQQLYDDTMIYEENIRKAGYNLVIKWGK